MSLYLNNETITKFVSPPYNAGVRSGFNLEEFDNPSIAGTSAATCFTLGYSIGFELAGGTEEELHLMLTKKDDEVEF